MLRYAIGALIAVGALALIWVLAVTQLPPSGDPRTFARGAVSAFEFVEDPKPVPETPFVNGEGAEITLADFKGKVVLVNLWATWCGPCKTEMPTLNALQAEMGGEDFEVVAISLDRRGPEAARQFLDLQELENIALYNDRSGRILGKLAMYGNFAVRGLPATLLVDRNSKVVGRLIGPAEWDTPEAKALLRHFIEE